MLKKILLASALATSAAFADWDSFQVLENHNGQAEVGISYANMLDKEFDYSRLATTASARFTIIPNLELALCVPYIIFVHIDGKDAHFDGFAQPSIGARYHIIPTMNVYAGVSIPVGDESLVAKNVWGFGVGVQYYTPINQLLNFGSELSVSASTKGEYRVAPLYAGASAELNFMVSPQFNPYVGVSTNVSLGGFTDDGYEYSEGGGTIDITPYIGASYKINEIVTLEATIGLQNTIYTKIDENSDTMLSTSLKAKFNF